MTVPIPLLNDLAKLTQAALFNARDLLGDARKLADAGSWPRAHALAVLALEETGKAGICVQAMGPLNQRTPEEFWKAFKSHEEKLEIARGVLEVKRGVIARVGIAAQALTSTRVRARRLFASFS